MKVKENDLYLHDGRIPGLTSLDRVNILSLKQITPLLAPNRIAKISFYKQVLSRLLQTHGIGRDNGVKSSSSGHSNKQTAILSAATLQKVLNKRKFELHK